LNCTNEEIAVFVREAPGFRQEAPLEIIPIAVRGSQRSFYRIRCTNDTSTVFMCYDGTRRENNYYADLSGFLRGIGIPVPRTLHHDPAKCFLLMEDLGEKDLWHCRQLPWHVRREYYFRTLDIVLKLHSFRQNESSVISTPMMEGFDNVLYRWEHDYFLQNFVRNVCNIELSANETESLDGELAFLAERLTGMAPCLIHRDLQSQNVMICSGEPVLIDFQGMRYGNLFYDLGSLLYDPYVSFTEEQRMELLDYYGKHCALQCDSKTFRETFMTASAQRLMQALGAYGFLGIKGNRPEFLRYIPQGLDNLIEATGADPNLFLLRNLTLRCREGLGKKQDDPAR
jgi:N-acetylmuramate 1-kinase